MRSVLLIAFWSLFCTGSNEKIQYLTEQHIYSRLTATVHTNMTVERDVTTESCRAQAPSGLEYSNAASGILFIQNSRISCGVNVTLHDESFIGQWTLISDVIISGLSRVQRRLPFYIHVIETEDGRMVEYLTGRNFNTTFGGVSQVTMGVDRTIHSETCEVETPSGTIITNTTQVDGLVFFQNSRMACGLNVTVQNGDFIGDWVLVNNIVISRTLRVQRRLRFNIHVEVTVNTNINEIRLSDGMDFYIRLRNPIHEYDTCQLIGGDLLVFTSYERDPRYTSSCGYVVRNVRSNNAGTWEIRYGVKTVYRARFIVNVVTNTPLKDSTSNLTLIMNRPADINVGPDNVVYCKLQDPRGIIVFDGFGRCNIVLPCITLEHHGIWRMSVGFEGRILVQDSSFSVFVVEEDPKIANTTVISNKPFVTVSCSVSSPHPTRSCKFREPSGRILIATEGVGESRYSFHGSGVRTESGIHTYDCGIQISEPRIPDLGLWRCVVETEGGNYYGFPKVLCPWALQDPNIADEILTEPTLTADHTRVSAVEGVPVTLSCSIQSPLRYCYFRATNGTVYNVRPDHPLNNVTYVGAGLNSGECGIGLPTLAVTDTGIWSCHVGVFGEKQSQQRATIAVTVHDSMVAEQRVVNGRLHVEGRVYGQRALEYCRYIRTDGLEFSGDDQELPIGYINEQSLSTGICKITIESPTILDNHPWTVVARLWGQEDELFRVTNRTIEIPEDNETVTDVDDWTESEIEGTTTPESELDAPRVGSTVYYSIPLPWMIVMSSCLVLIVIAMLFGPRNNRCWTFKRANAIRDSLRNSFMRKEINQTNDRENTAVAA